MNKKLVLDRYLVLVKNLKHPIQVKSSLRIRYTVMGLSKILKKYKFIFFIEPSPSKWKLLNGTSYQPPFMYPNMVRNILYLEIYYPPNFDALIQCDFRANQKIA